MTGKQRIAAHQAAHADQHVVRPPDWQAALPRLETLRRLRLKTLPTARVVRWNYIISGVCGVVALAWLAVGGLFLLCGAIAGVAAVVEFVHAGERARSIRTGAIGAGTLERLLDHHATDSVLSAGEIVTAALDTAPEELVKSIAGSITQYGDTIGKRYVRFVERLLRKHPPPLCPGERPLVIAAATLRQYDHPRFVASGVLTMTERRLIFIVRAFSRPEVLLADPIAQVQVCEWFRGNRPLQRFQWILSVRRPTGQRVDLQFLRLVWTQQARTVFESLASISEREPPPALEAYWHRIGVARRVA
jgi:hypothetical protein